MRDLFYLPPRRRRMPEVCAADVLHVAAGAIATGLFAFAVALWCLGHG